MPATYIPCMVKPARPRAFRGQLRMVRAILDCISPFPARKNLRKKVMRPGQSNVQGFTLGMTKKLNVHDKLVSSKYNKRFPELWLACQRLIETAVPNFKYNCIQVNKDQQTAAHVDAFNKGPSIIVGFGDYEGGGLIVRYRDASIQGDIHNSMLAFDGRVLHETEPFKGSPRYSLVFFTLALKHTLLDKQPSSPSGSSTKLGTCKRNSL